MAASDAVVPITPEQAYRRLRDHPDWIVERDRLRRSFRLPSFVAAIALVNRLADVAETVGHHPNLRVHEWCFLDVETYSHVSGGLTTRDLDLVLAIDAMLAEHAQPAG